MTLDWWSLGLQAVNFLILAWLLGRVFWRPVSAAIARRQETAQEMLDAGQATQARADAALAEVQRARDGIAAERDAMLAEAQATAESASKAALAEARARADALLAEARNAIARDREAARKESTDMAASLSVEMAARLLERFNTAPVRAGFLEQLTRSLAALSPADRAALAASPRVEVVSATPPDAAEKPRIEQALNDALDRMPALQFVTDPTLIAGLELRGPHFVLRNSWRADLETLAREVKDAA